MALECEGGDFYGRVVDRFVQQAIRGEPITVYGDGKQTRSFTYVKDTVTALLMLILKGKEGEIYNIGNDEEISILDLAYEVKRVCKSSSEIQFKTIPEDEPMRRAADIKKITELGFTHSFSLEEGIKNMSIFK